MQNFNATADSDGDSLSALEEAQLGTNPNKIDDDDDGQNDNVDSATLTAAVYGLVDPTFDATPTPNNPIRRWYDTDADTATATGPAQVG